MVHRMNWYERVPKGRPEEGQVTRWDAFSDSQPLQERLMVAEEARREARGSRVYRVFRQWFSMAVP